MNDQSSGDMFAKLREPFPSKDVEWRIGQCGIKKNGEVWAKALAYLKLDAIENRLDDIAGAGNWSNVYEAGPTGGQICGLRICFEGNWVTKWDGAENTEFEGVKGGLTDSFKRAARRWGIGRYLWQLGESFVAVVPNTKGANYAKTKDGAAFYWLAPTLPASAVPAGEKPKPAPKPAPTQQPVAVTDVDNAAFYAKLLDRAGFLDTLDACDTALRYVGECLNDMKITKLHADNLCGVIRARRNILPKPQAQVA